MLKPEENPPVSHPADKALADYVGQWWVAHTRSRNEKALARDILQKNVNYFLPMSWRVRRHRGRKMRALLPLFSGYLFFCGTERDRLEVLRTNRVATVIDVVDQSKLVAELTQIESALGAGAELQPHKYIKAGQLCRVIAGPLAELEGVFVKSQTHSRLVLKVDMLGQATSVEVDADMIELIE